MDPLGGPKSSTLIGFVGRGSGSLVEILSRDGFAIISSLVNGIGSEYGGSLNISCFIISSMSMANNLLRFVYSISLNLYKNS